MKGYVNTSGPFFFLSEKNFFGWEKNFLRNSRKFFFSEFDSNGVQWIAVGVFFPEQFKFWKSINSSDSYGSLKSKISMFYG